MEYLPAIISAIGTIIAAWFAYNQYTKNQLTDLKVEQFKAEQERKTKRRADNSALVHGELWQVLHELQADRVYIVQPHPLGNESMVSVYFESKRKGVESMKPRIQHLKMCDIARFCSDLTKNTLMLITDIPGQVGDRYARSLLSCCGTTEVVIRRLSDNNHDWVGSIFCEFTHDTEISQEKAHKVLDEAALNIQYILPEFVD